ncbi:MAG: hypothetical protein R3B13_07090 [Polyangiaceae bacterium]
MTQPGCPNCATPTLVSAHTGGVTFVCGGCRGAWLAPEYASALNAVIPAQPRAAQAHERCPMCSQSLFWQPRRGPTTCWTGECRAHGVWLPRHSLPAVSDPAQRQHVLQAMLHFAQLQPETRAACQTAVAALVSGAQSMPLMRGLVRPLGNPALVTIGVGAVADDGVSVIEPDGRHRVLYQRVSRWTMTLLVAAVLVVTGVITILIFVFTQDATSTLIVAAAFAVITFLGVGMFAGLAMVQPRSSILVDGPRRTLLLATNGNTTARIPFALVNSVRIQCYTNPGYGEYWDLLLTFGIAEVWVAQLDEYAEARAAAEVLARAMGAWLEPEVERKGG